MEACPRHSAFLSAGRDGVVNAWSIAALKKDDGSFGTLLAASHEPLDPIQVAHKREKELNAWKNRYYDLIIKQVNDKSVSEVQRACGVPVPCLSCPASMGRRVFNSAGGGGGVRRAPQNWGGVWEKGSIYRNMNHCFELWRRRRRKFF